MKRKINLYDFQDAFRKMDRGNQFSYDGLKALFEYLEQYEEETGEEIELDVIALCCDYAEYTILEAIEEYATEFSSIENNTTIIYVDDLKNNRNVDDEENLDCRVIIQSY